MAAEISLIYPLTEPCSGAFFFIVIFYLFNRYRIGKMEIHADFWPGQSLSKKLCGRRGLYVSFSTAGLHLGSWINRLQWVEKSSMWRFMWRKPEFYGVIWRCFASVKCGSIMSGFWKCCDCRETHLLWDLPKVLTDKSQVCAVELALPEYFVPSIKTLRERLV